MTSRFGRYLTMEDLERDANELGEEWLLAEWYPCEETFEQRDQNDHISRWQQTVFYARYIRLPKPEPKPGGMKAR